MDTVIVSPKYQVVIPASVRESMDIKPGEKVNVFGYDGRIEFIPQKSIKAMRGFLKGIDTTVQRERDRV